MKPIHQVLAEKHMVEVTSAEIDLKADTCFSMLMFQVLNLVSEI